MKVKNSELKALLLMIASQKEENGKIIPLGLVNESISLGVKRRLQKIFKEAHKFYLEFEEDVKAVPEGSEEEMNKLFDEEITLAQEPVSLTMLEAIQTENNYDWDLIEKIAQ